MGTTPVASRVSSAGKRLPGLPPRKPSLSCLFPSQLSSVYERSARCWWADWSERGGYEASDPTAVGEWRCSAFQHGVARATRNSAFELAMKRNSHFGRCYENQPAVGIALISLVWITLFGAPGLVQAVGITALGGLPGGGGGSYGAGISADGNVVVGYASAGNYSQAIIWTRSGGMVGLGYMPGATYNGTYAYAASADGTVVVGAGKTTYWTGEAFRWTAATGIVRLGLLPGGSAFPNANSFANAVSADGAVLVGWSATTNGSNRAFRWTEATGMVGLDVLPDCTASGARGMSADGGVVVGFAKIPMIPTPCRWTQADGMAVLQPTLRGADNEAYAVSADGNTIVGSTSTEAFRWTKAVGSAAMGGMRANAISADGSVAVGLGSSTNAIGAEAYVWMLPGAARTLSQILAAGGADLSHWRYLTEAKGVSGDGRYVTGYGVATNGVGEGFLADIGPRVSLSMTPVTNGCVQLTWSGVSNQMWLGGG